MLNFSVTYLLNYPPKKQVLGHRHVLGLFIRECGSFLKYVVLVSKTTSKSVLMQCFQMAKSVISSCRRIGETILQHLLAKPSDNCCCSLFSEAAAGSVLQHRCSYKNRKILKKAPMLESLFNKAARPEACFPVSSEKLLRTSFFTEQLRWLLLIILDYMILYQARTAHPLSRRITSTQYEFN